jgi:micrococcal nuclease
MLYIRRTSWAGVLLALVVMAGPGTASAATCADHPNQASAQRAKDTRDADGDGIYCESLPCPCLRPGQDTGGSPAPRPKPKPRKRAQVISARITSVVDGDTLRVRAFNAKRAYYTVRLIGVDTPETKRPGRPVECGGKRAFSKLLELSFTDPLDSDGDGLFDDRGGDGRRVTLTTDPTQDTRYRRLLAYVTTRQGVYLQTALLSAGWAKTYVFERPFQRVSRHRAAEARARRNGRGVWRMCNGNFHKPL